MAARIAVEYDVPYETLDNLVTSESEWNPRVVSPTGDYGLAAINLRWNPEITKEQAFDPEFALRFVAKVLQDGREAQMYTVCNCYSFAKVLTGYIGPYTQNSAPTEGSIAVFDYDGTPHYGVVQTLKLDGFTIREANYKPCKTGIRFVKWDDSALRGFHLPTQ